MMKPRYGIFIVAMSWPAYATIDVYKPANMELGSGWKLTPQLRAAVGFDDNTAHTNSDETDSWFLELAPELLLHAGNEVTSYKIGYLLIDGNYFSSSEDDYTDHRFKVDLSHDFTRRHRLDFNYTYRRDHEARGKGITEGNGNNVNEVAEFDVQDVSATYGFGIPTAKLNADFKLGYYQKDYTNFEPISDFRDYDAVLGSITGYWRLSQKTSIVLQWLGEDKTYDRSDATGSRDSFTQTLLGGVKWEATSNTIGEVKVGYENRDFDDGDREDFDGLAWEARVVWKPRSYSTFEFTTGNRAKDPDTFGDYVEEQSYQLNWHHKWRERMATNFDLQYLDESYTGIDRDDEEWTMRVGLEYAWRRWLVTEFSYAYSDHSSDLQQVEYDKSVWLLSTRIAL